MEAGAEAYGLTFIDSLWTVCDRIAAVEPNVPLPYVWVESLNEEVPTFNEEKLRRICDFDVAFAEWLIAAEPRARPIGFCAAVGNPHESEFEIVTPMAVRYAELGGALGYHAYWGGDRERSYLASHYQWHAGRWAEMDEVFCAAGAHVRWIFGECGVVGTTNQAQSLDLCNDGWRSGQVYNGDWSRYEDDLMEFDL